MNVDDLIELSSPTLLPSSSSDLELDVEDNDISESTHSSGPTPSSSSSFFSTMLGSPSSSSKRRLNPSTGTGPNRDHGQRDPKSRRLKAQAGVDERSFRERELERDPRVGAKWGNVAVEKKEESSLSDMHIVEFLRRSEFCNHAWFHFR